MRQGKVFYNEHLAGVLIETNEGEYVFRYDASYAKEYPGDFITFTMPVALEQYTDKRLFSFFDGLIPEGWLLDIASETWRINRNDRMGLLLACCQNCIGAVSVVPIHEDDVE
jgi:serine/threonine-protein kinase HipA